MSENDNVDYEVGSQDNSDFMYYYVKKIIDKVGPRAPGSTEEKLAVDIVAKDMKDMGFDEVDVEDFTLYPRAFLGWTRLISILFVISFLVYLLVNVTNVIAISSVSFAICLFIVLMLYKQFLSYEEWLPKFLPYKEKTSHNVVGKIKPSGEIKKRVVVSGHIDSAYTFNLIEFTRQGYAASIVLIVLGFALTGMGYLLTIVFEATGANDTIPALIIAWIGFLMPFLTTFVIYVLGKSPKILMGAVSKVHPYASILMIYTLVYGSVIDAHFYGEAILTPTLYDSIVLAFCQSIPAIVAFFLYLGKQAVPGAIDNLTGVAAAMCIGKILNDWKREMPHLVPKNTEVVVGIFGSEEAGLRGSTAFSKSHAEEYNKIDTTCVNFESLSESKVQTVYDFEATTKTKMSPEVYNLVAEACEDVGIPYRIGQMPSIAGGTDATGLRRGGLKATSIEGLRYSDYLSYYHTSRDNMSNINLKRKEWKDIGPNWHHRNVRGAMEMGVMTMIRYIQMKDDE